jgi:hypothetical protein
VIFKHDDPIDNNILNLARRFRALIQETPSAVWSKERDLWILGSENYLSHPVFISYHWIDKNKYEAFTEGHGFGSFETAKEAVDAVNLLKFMEEGISNEVIQFLASKVKNPDVTIQEAVNLITKETNEVITVSQMKIMGIDQKQLGAVVGKKFGV